MQRYVSIILANALVLAVLGWFGYLHETDSDAYYLAVQEDAPMEWSTCAAFFLAAFLHWYEAYRRRGHTRSALFAVALGVFCLIFAGEEISWFQRVAGYQPPDYFLANNYQQEFNFHNVMSTDLRKLTLQLIMFGYGVALPLLFIFKVPREFGSKIGIIGPPISMVPAFGASYLLYYTYPWSYCGEIAEMMLGLCFLFAPILRLMDSSARITNLDKLWIRPLLVADAWILSFALGVTASTTMFDPSTENPFAKQTTAIEIAALEHDFTNIVFDKDPPSWTKENRHYRIFTLIRKKDVDSLRDGNFVDAAIASGDEDRAQFFIDPWKTAYWTRLRKRSGEMVITLYSFGPNRRRDSTRGELRGDDIGTVIRVR
jgi:hypothetical protein